MWRWEDVKMRRCKMRKWKRKGCPRGWSTFQYYFVLYTSQYYLVLQCLHKVLPSTTSYHKACTKYFPVLRTTKLAERTSQYCFVLPSTTSYYKACIKYIPVYFVLQSLHKVLQNRNFYSVFDDRTSFRAKELPRMLNRNFTSVIDDRTSFREKRLPRRMLNRNCTSVFDDRTSFRAKGLRRTTQNRKFTSVFDDRTSFRAKRLRFVAPRWHCPAP